MSSLLPLAGRVVGITADRRWQEQATLIERRGATIVHGPTMTTVDLTADHALRAATESVVADPPSLVIVTTGVGFKSWLDTAEVWGLRDRLLHAMSSDRTRVIARGAKGASAVRGVGLELAWRAEHESMDEVVDHVASVIGPNDHVVLQLFDPDDHWATLRLRELAHERARGPLLEVPLYRWRLPEDLAPAEALVEQVLARTVDAVTFTSQPAVRFLFEVADGLSVRDGMAAALARDVLAVCVGPVCAEALYEAGVDRVVWPDPPRLVPMVKLLEQHLGEERTRAADPAAG
ncbi:MAG TPA: uroporphyrinogen-III synthase [Acidimicrobiales bacterium]